MNRDGKGKVKLGIYIVQLSLLAFFSTGWWGLMYPNFSMTEDTFQAVDVQETENPDRKEESPDMVQQYFDMIEAKPGEIQVKSRLLDVIEEIRGKENDK